MNSYTTVAQNRECDRGLNDHVNFLTVIWQIKFKKSLVKYIHDTCNLLKNINSDNYDSYIYLFPFLSTKMALLKTILIGKHIYMYKSTITLATVIKDVKYTNHNILPCSGWFSMQVRLVAMFFLISVKLRCLGICLTCEKKSKI